MKIATHLAALAAAAIGCATPALATDAGPVRGGSIYKATYNPATEKYCIRALRDDATGETRPFGWGLNCRSKAAWERAGLTITHHLADHQQVAQRR